jgi:ribosomal protein S18 acetylase RimI-like enzyme
MAQEAMPILVRTTRAADAHQLRELRLEALRLHPVAFTADLAESEAQPPEFWVDRATVGAGTDGRQALFVAELDGALVGMAGIYVDPKRPKLAHSATIWGAYVRAAARRRGIGQKLVGACADWGRANDLRIVKLSAVNDGPARRCYERCGFVTYGVEPMAVQVDARFYDESLMALKL